MLQADVAAIAFDPSTRGPVVLLKRADAPEPPPQLVPIALGPIEAYSIVSALQGNEPPRPMTHDLTCNIMLTMGAHIQHAEIHSFIDGTYIASLTFRQNGVTFVVDARPSDAIALVVRQRAPLYIDEKVFDLTAVDANVVTHVGIGPAMSSEQFDQALKNFTDNITPSDFA
ncbi:MAG: DUF151 domain-containing protein [Actinomycetes bacterium]|jgi:bifunctional DNase/RNase|nr:DUF151 domain-containing protein [Actinomycetes bacterium]